MIFEVMTSTEQQLRKHPRARLTFLVQFRFKDFDSFVREWAQNLSVGGLFVRTREPYESGTLVVISFALDGGQSLIEGLARVVHHDALGMGLEFVSLDENSQRTIEDVISRAIAQSR